MMFLSTLLLDSVSPVLVQSDVIRVAFHVSPCLHSCLFCCDRFLMCIFKSINMFKAVDPFCHSHFLEALCHSRQQGSDFTVALLTLLHCLIKLKRKPKYQP